MQCAGLRSLSVRGRAQLRSLLGEEALRAHDLDAMARRRGPQPLNSRDGRLFALVRFASVFFSPDGATYEGERLFGLRAGALSSRPFSRAH